MREIKLAYCRLFGQNLPQEWQNGIIGYSKLSSEPCFRTPPQKKKQNTNSLAKYKLVDGDMSRRPNSYLDLSPKILSEGRYVLEAKSSFSSTQAGCLSCYLKVVVVGKTLRTLKGKVLINLSVSNLDLPPRSNTQQYIELLLHLPLLLGGRSNTYNSTRQNLGPLLKVKLLVSYIQKPY